MDHVYLKEPTNIFVIFEISDLDIVKAFKVFSRIKTSKITTQKVCVSIPSYHEFVLFGTKTYKIFYIFHF